MNEYRNSSQMEFLQWGIAVIDLSHVLYALIRGHNINIYEKTALVMVIICV